MQNQEKTSIISRLPDEKEKIRTSSDDEKDCWEENQTLAKNKNP